jgi:FAD binding domain
LAWKLALVLKGVAGSELLSTYDMERRPAATFTVEQAYTRYVTRSATYLGAKDFQPLANDFDIELSYLYRSPAILSEDESDRVHEERPGHSSGISPGVGGDRSTGVAGSRGGGEGASVRRPSR